MVGNTDPKWSCWAAAQVRASPTRHRAPAACHQPCGGRRGASCRRMDDCSPGPVPALAAALGRWVPCTASFEAAHRNLASSRGDTSDGVGGASSGRGMMGPAPPGGGPGSPSPAAIRSRRRRRRRSISSGPAARFGVGPGSVFPSPRSAKSRRCRMWSGSTTGPRAPSMRAMRRRRARLISGNSGCCRSGRRARPSGARPRRPR